MPPHGDQVRARLLDAVRRDPGVNLADAAKALAMDPSTVGYHARILARRRKLAVQPAGRSLALFAAGDGACPWMREALPCLRDPRARAAAAMLLEGPVPVGRVARAQGLGRCQASRMLRRMERAGIARRARTGMAALHEERRACLERALRRQRCRPGACQAQVRRLTLSPSPSGRMSVSTPGVEDARRL
jgi:DNA-binding IclR family transcriptional regulator